MCRTEGPEMGVHGGGSWGGKELGAGQVGKWREERGPHLVQDVLVEERLHPWLDTGPSSSPLEVL